MGRKPDDESAALKISSDIPIPNSSGTGIAATLRGLAVGDSFLLPDGLNRVAAYIAAKRVGIKVLTRNVVEDGVSGVRVWRKS